jgi:hypothetical protein
VLEVRFLHGESSASARGCAGLAKAPNSSGTLG